MYFVGDCFSAEIQNISNAGGDGGSVISLHTRSMKYGKLENGVLCQVSCMLIPRLPQHYVSIPVTSVDPGSNATTVNSMDIILGKNGFIWITSAYVDCCLYSAVLI